MRAILPTGRHRYRRVGSSNRSSSSSSRASPRSRGGSSGLARCSHRRLEKEDALKDKEKQKQKEMCEGTKTTRKNIADLID
jgi:hypothetical protein